MSYISRFITLSVALIPAQVVAQGLGDPAYPAIAAATPIAGGITSVSSAADVATLLTATQISAQAADDLTTMFSQRRTPARVWVATYNGSTGDPTDALNALEAAETDFGPIVQESRTDTDNELVAAWVAADVYRLWAHPTILQTASADMITSGKPSALEDCEISAVTMHYHGTATEPQAAAHAGLIGGFPLISGPLGMHTYLQGVDLPSLTSAERAFAIANDAATLAPLALGASASQRIIEQVDNYSGDGFTAVLTIMYAIRRCIAAIQGVTARHAITGAPLFANPAGEGEVYAVLAEVLQELAGVGHFQAGTAGTPPDDVPLPSGWRIVTSTAGAVITATVTLIVGQEAVSLSLPITALEQ